MIARKYFIITALWAGLFVHAQNKQLLYDFTEVPQALMINPGMETDFSWYAGIPALSGISFQAGSSGISVNDIFADDGLNINDKVRDRAIYGMSVQDELSGTYQVEIFNGGFRGKDPSVFYSFGLYNEGDAIGYWFRDYAILGYEGNADRLNQRFDLSHLKTRGEMLNVFHFGVNKKVSSDLILGARGKIYSSIFDFNSVNNEGYFVTTEGQNNTFASTLNADLELRTSGVNAIDHAHDDDNIPATVIKRGLFGGDLGLGVDLGFTYYLNSQTVLTGSLLDLGFVYHANDVENFALQGSATIEGMEIILPDALSDPNQDFWQNLVDDVEGFIPFEKETTSYLTFRPTKLYGSIRYNFGEPMQGSAQCDCDYRTSGKGPNTVKYRNSVGGQLYVINRPRGPQSAITAFYQRRFGNFMAIKTTYTADKFTFTNIGLGASIQAGPVNFYLMADNLLAYRNIADSNYTSFQFGLNIISWGKK
ncbi:hypothetical protein HPE56_10340 [Maribacter sp. ANRC-HE7]|uniref:DUF5723 domain-containing protein n=1 Tax=Maribacter aquimaris TaxID=2737171 RepID=A0ABR7V070_9FLAO|nr:DUF5723 family protein [Maribacter aquimaris]MBD0778193.1 hypothetical protein [Maribacter aquimaris]